MKRRLPKRESVFIFQTVTPSFFMFSLFHKTFTSMIRLKNRSLVSITDYNKEEILKVLDIAEDFEQNQRQRILTGYVIASLFFEPSTRTRLSFESAVQYMGGSIVGFASADTSSVRKGESLKDTILTVSNYSDLIVMRNPLDGSAR
jgi:aspartate carbamoyltransferase catalytic subunit